MLFPELMQVIDPEPHSAALNMAIDEVLLDRATQPTLRIYRWVQPAVSFGYFGKVADVRAAWPARELVRRWTGGGIVAHGEDVTYTLIVPRECAFFRLAARESYRVIHEQIRRGLAAGGLRAEVVATAAATVSAACFENAAQFDVLAHGAKVAGAAQRRTRSGLLHQGSIQGLGKIAEIRDWLPSVFAEQLHTQLLGAEEQTAAGRLAAQKYGAAVWQEKF